jgi:hypothetical protein
MPLHLVTPFDLDGDPPPVESARTPARLAWLRKPFADVCYILLKASAFLGAIYLAVLGLPLLFFLALVGGDLELLFTQLGNLSAHYLAADHARQAMFAGELKLGLFGTATLVAIWKLPRFLDDVSATLDREEVA